jgi:hypothetical protein
MVSWTTAAGCRSSSREGMTGYLTEGFTGRFDSEVGLVTVKGEQRQLALVDKWLETERNDEECGKLLRGRMGWCAAPFIGPGQDEALRGRQPVRWILTQSFLKLKGGKRRRGDVVLMGERKGVT